MEIKTHPPNDAADMHYSVVAVSGQEPRWTFNFELPLLTLMSRFSTVLLLIIFTEIMPKESVTSLKQQNQDLKDKVDALSKEIGTLRSDDGDGNGDATKAIGLISETTILHVHHAFLYISLPSLHDYDVKMPNFTMYRGSTLAKTRFPLSF